MSTPSAELQRRPLEDRREMLLAEAFEHLVEYVSKNCLKAPQYLPDTIYLNIGCPEAQEEHNESWRQFAHTYHDADDKVCVARELGEQPLSIIFGILCHELGHIMAMNAWNDSCEENADRASGEFLEMTIHYTEPPKYLEYLEEEDMKKLGMF